MPEPMTLRGACHCGEVRFEAVLPDGLSKPRRCTCSICRMRGAVAVTVDLDGLRITAGADRLTEYRFNTGVARHYFCSRCGIYTHHKRRSNPDQYGLNVASLEGVSPFDFAEVIVGDGVNHPNDVGESRVAGVLRFEKAGE